MSSGSLGLDLDDVGGSRNWLSAFSSIYGIIGAVACGLGIVEALSLESWLYFLYGFLVFIACLVTSVLLRGAVDILDYFKVSTNVQLETLKHLEVSAKKRDELG